MKKRGKSYEKRSQKRGMSHSGQQPDTSARVGAVSIKRVDTAEELVIKLSVPWEVKFSEGFVISNPLNL